MKRFTIFITLLLLSVMQMAAQDTSIKGTITLSHQGKTTDFAYNNMAGVMEAAVDGDTVFLSKGYFEGDFILDKKLVFIGSGADQGYGWGNCTCYGSNNIVIKLPENTKLDARLFEGIYFGDTSFTYQSSIEDVVFKKCRVYGCLSFSADIKRILFDRCDILVNGYCNSFTKKLIARNCQISNLCIRSDDGYAENTWQFINCTIDPDNWSYTDDNGNYHIYCPIYRGSFVNCIIDNDENRDEIRNAGYCLYDPNNIETKSSASFTNCLFYKPLEGREIFNGATVLNDMYFDASNLNDDWENKIRYFSKEKLQENNFLGNDGTVVGCYGGKKPYSLKQNQPTITSGKIHFDKDKKQIQIKMKVSSEQ
jgi:hypothetical protein